jgi:hypothetical protein
MQTKKYPHMKMTQNQERRRKIAETLLPLYNKWHMDCVKSPFEQGTADSEARLWEAVRANNLPGMPTTITAAVGRWIARQLDMEWKAFKGVVNREHQKVG